MLQLRITILQLGIIPETTDLTPQEAQESLVARIAYLFSEKVGKFFCVLSDGCFLL
jgi:hypothetical protein